MSGVWIQSYGCTSAAGPSTAGFWSSLQSGADHSEDLPIEGALGARAASVRACLWKEVPPADVTARQCLVTQMLQAFEGAVDQLDPPTRQRVLTSGRLGVILASTKSFVDDYIWSDTVRADDSFTPLLQDFLIRAGLTAVRTIAVSNACSSSHGALFLAKRWLKRGEIRDVLVIAADRIGPFIARGFHALHVVTPDTTRPFSAERNGLQLGEATAAMLLSSTPGPFEVDGVEIESEGVVLRHSSDAGSGLIRACLRLQDIRSVPPDLIIAHGTATRVNDAIEDQVFASLFHDPRTSPPITATKWCIGHTMGASGAMDLIAACEVIRHQQAFRIATTHRADPVFTGRYLSAGSDELPGRVRRVLITSIAFGGFQAAASVRSTR